MTSYWSISTLILYICYGFSAYFCLKQNNTLSIRGYNSRLKIDYCIFVLISAVFASSRYVNKYGIGGTDAHSYVEFFINSRSGIMTSQWVHYEGLYKLITRTLRFFSDDYHFFFFIIYGFIAFSYVRFYENFKIKYQNSIPLILIAFVFVEGFNTLRTSLSVAFILLGLVEMKHNRKIKCAIWMILSCFIQKAALIYAVFPLAFFFVRNKITVKKAVALSIIATVVAKIGQYVLVERIFVFSSGHNYAYYASRSLGQSFFDNYWKIAFEQIMLLVAVLVYKKKIERCIKSVNDSEINARYNLILAMCYFDFLLIPLTYILDIWRAYENFYIPRLLMWGILIDVIKKGQTIYDRRIVNVLCYMIVICWLVFRWFNIWKANDLMPYVFAPFTPYNGLE